MYPPVFKYIDSEDDMEKNDIYQITIEDMSEDGSGIGHIDGMAVFVKDTVVGDTADIRIVKVKKSYAYGRLEKIIDESPFRTEAVCPVARQCGGCTLQHISYEKELELKQNKVMGCLKRIGGIDEPEKYLEGTYGNESYLRYRNKMQFPVGKNKDGKTVLGFYAGRTHSLIPVDDCHIGHKVNRYIAEAVCSWADSFGITVYDEKTGKGLLRHVLTRIGFATGELMVCLVINGKKIPHDLELLEKLKAAVEQYNSALNDEGNEKADIRISLNSVVANINTAKTNKILGDKTFVISGEEYITDHIGDVKFRISAQSFYQVNPAQTGKLYGKALEFADLSGEETVWDMYCGIGTISLFLAGKAKKVFGVEIVPQAILDAKKNAEINGIENAVFYTGAAEDVVGEIYEKGAEGSSVDVVVVDPPRKGCDEKLLSTIKGMNPKRMVYVSCDPATLARDLKTLIAEGFELEKVAIYDQFSRSFHVETVVLLSHE